MVSFEDIIDDAKCFLKGKMSEEEAKTFILLLDQHSHLKEEFDLMQRMVLAMEEIPAREVEFRLKRGKEQLTRYGILSGRGLVYFIIFLLLFLLIYLLASGTDKLPLSPDLEKKGLSTYSGNEKTGLAANTASSLAMGPDGHLYIAGNFYQEIKFGPERLVGDSNSLDFFLLKLTPELDIEWSKAYGGPGNDYVNEIVVDHQSSLIFSGSMSDTLYLDNIQMSPRRNGAGDLGSDLFIAKMNLNHEVIWAQHDGSPNIPYVSSGSGAINQMALDEHNNIYAVGNMHGPSIWDHPIPQTKATNAFLAKIDQQGEIKWIQTLVGEYGVLLFGLDIKGSSLASCGVFGHKNLSGDIVLGDRIQPSLGGNDIMITQYDTNGIFQWGRTAGSSTLGLAEGGYSLKYAEDGSLKMTGTFDGSAQFGSTRVTARVGRDFFLASYSSAGDPEWIVAEGGGTLKSKNTDWDLGSDLQMDQQGNIYVCGVFGAGAVFGSDTLQMQGVQDLFVAKYSPMGQLIWIKPFGGDSEMVNMESAMEMVVNDRGDCYVTGYFSGDLFIDDQQLQSQGHSNIFILALDGSGRIKQFNQLFAAVTQTGDDPI